MIDILGTLVIIGMAGYLGYYLLISYRDGGPDAQGIYDSLMLKDYEGEMADLQRENDRAKYQQLRIRQRALDKEIAKLEKTKDTNKLGDLYKERASLKKEISEVASRL